LAALASGAANEGIVLRVYGSLALQVLTGQAYLTASSDIDLLVRPRDAAGLDAALALLGKHAQRLPLDGEIVFPGGRAVAWKEWAAACAGAPGSRVLVKEMTRVSLVTTDTLLAALEEQTCTN
jgi:phosphoribosyl-dephospho-CoA transferase